MEKKLNLHDLFGILFPGAMLCGCVYVFLVKVGFIASGRLDWSATLAMLPAAYAAGLLIHEAGSRLLHEREVALSLMQDSDPTFTPQFKERVKAAFAELFALPSEGQMMFNGCYDYVIQQGKASMSRTFMPRTRSAAACCSCR